MVTSVIVGFSKDAAHPLLLEDNFVLGLDDFIGKVEVTKAIEMPTEAAVAAKRPRDEANTPDAGASRSAKRARYTDQTSTTKANERAVSASVTSAQHSRLIPLRKFLLIAPDAVTTEDTNNDDDDDDDDKRLIDVVAAAADHEVR